METSTSPLPVRHPGQARAYAAWTTALDAAYELRENDPVEASRRVESLRGQWDSPGWPVVLVHR